MKNKLLLLVACLSVIAVLVPLWFGGKPDDVAPAEMRRDTVRAESAPSAPPDPSILDREAQPVASSTPPAAKAPAPTLGQVLDLRGAPVAGVQVAFEREAGGGRDPSVELVESGEDGTFEFVLPEQRGCLFAQGARWATVRRAWLDGTAPLMTPTVLVAPPRDYAGTVVDPDGMPVAAARVVIEVDDTLLPVISVGGTALALPHDLAAVDTDEAGHFVIAGSGWVAGARITARFEPFATASVELPEASTHDLMLRLGGPVDPEKQVHGIVLDSRGRPVASALVAVGSDAVRTRRDGTFLASWGWHRPGFVRAVASELGAVTAVLQSGAGQPGWTKANPIVLQFSGQPSRLHGRVVDSAGAPVAGAFVVTPDLTWFGTVTRREGGHEISGGTSVEALVRGRPRRSVGTVSAADGSFELNGMLPRDYALFALDPRSLAGVGPVVATPSAAVELRIPDAGTARVAGRVVAFDGSPLAGIQVMPCRRFDWEGKKRSPDPWEGAPVRRTGAGRCVDQSSRVTDEDGRFAFEALTTDGGYLVFRGEELFSPRPCWLTPDKQLGELEIKLDVRSRFRIVLSSGDPADKFSLVNSKGQRQLLFVRIEASVMSMDKVKLADGVSPVASTNAGEATVVLWRAGEEVRRQTVQFRSGGVHEVRL